MHGPCAQSINTSKMCPPPQLSLLIFTTPQPPLRQASLPAEPAHLPRNLIKAWRFWLRAHWKSCKPNRGRRPPAFAMAATSNMFMYSLTIKPPSAINQAILGQFMGTKEQQIATSCGSRITLHRSDPNEGTLVPLHTHDFFGIIRQMATFRLAGSIKGEFLFSSPKCGLVISQACPMPPLPLDTAMDTCQPSPPRNLEPPC